MLQTLDRRKNIEEVSFSETKKIPFLLMIFSYFFKSSSLQIINECIMYSSDKNIYNILTSVNHDFPAL